jgi:hypothetical protein
VAPMLAAKIRAVALPSPERAAPMRFGRGLRTLALWS